MFAISFCDLSVCIVGVGCFLTLKLSLIFPTASLDGALCLVCRNDFAKDSTEDPPTKTLQTYSWFWRNGAQFLLRFPFDRLRASPRCRGSHTLCWDILTNRPFAGLLGCALFIHKQLYKRFMVQFFNKTNTQKCVLILCSDSPSVAPHLASYLAALHSAMFVCIALGQKGTRKTEKEKE